jgi:hypothetical protein
MNEFLRDRILRKLDTLSDERMYQVLDFVEYLESRYAERQNPPANAFSQFIESVEDRLRAGRVSASTIAETVGLMNKAVGVLNGVAAAGKSVASDLYDAAVTPAKQPLRSGPGAVEPARPSQPSSASGEKPT